MRFYTTLLKKSEQALQQICKLDIGRSNTRMDFVIHHSESAVGTDLYLDDMDIGMGLYTT